jgi:GH25 family lysozyme M1 (1,4-beta-N-acetylmuramidase)
MRFLRPASAVVLAVSCCGLLLAPACGEESVYPGDGRAPAGENTGEVSSSINKATRVARYKLIRSGAAAKGIPTHGYMLAGIAYHESAGLSQCQSELTWACKGPASPDCNGGAIMAGAGDGPCSAQQGGLGIFQFDAGTYSQTISAYGKDVVTIEGATKHAVDFVVNMVKKSVYTTNAETDAKALAWINAFDPSNKSKRDAWIKTVLRYYNGCQPGWSCWSERYSAYNAGLSTVLAETGTAFWAEGAIPDAPSVCAKDKVTRGVDVADRNQTIKWSTVRKNGYGFAYVRVSDGVKNVDKKFSYNWENAQKVGMIRGAYQYFRPGQDPVAQAKLVIKKMGKLRGDELPVALAVQTDDGLSKSALSARIKKWAATIQKATKKKPLIYTTLKSFPLSGTKTFADNPLWIGDWKQKCPHVPDGGWKTWKVWQNHEGEPKLVTGISGPTSTDRFNGSVAQLRSYVGDKDGDGVIDKNDNCVLIANPDQKNTDKDKLGNACDKDDDGDGRGDTKDNCPQADNPDQTDTDNDKKGDACDSDDDNDGKLDAKDNCPLVKNAGQADLDLDGLGDACDPDIDGDGLKNENDNCPSVSNVDQADTDADGKGDACDKDADGDGAPDASDNCPGLPNPDQADTDHDGQGDACETDGDGDGVKDGQDNCPTDPNPAQTDSDNDKIGDDCDPDVDGDGVENDQDNCPTTANPDQADVDGDHLGNVCDDDRDNDLIPDAVDNCPDDTNGDQADYNGNGQGDECDPPPETPAPDGEDVYVPDPTDPNEPPVGELPEGEDGEEVEGGTPVGSQQDFPTGSAASGRSSDGRGDGTVVTDGGCAVSDTSERPASSQRGLWAVILGALGVSALARRRRSNKLP